MWVASFALRICANRDLLVGVHVDDGEIAAQLTERLAPWVDTSVSVPDDVGGALRIQTSDNTPDTPNGPTITRLSFGPHLLARSRDVHDIVNAADQVLGGIGALFDKRWLPWSVKRVFSTNSRAATVDLLPPDLVNDPRLARQGIVEQPVWVHTVDGTVLHLPAGLTETTPAAAFEYVGHIQPGTPNDVRQSISALLA